MTETCRKYTAHRARAARVHTRTGPKGGSGAAGGGFSCWGVRLRCVSSCPRVCVCVCVCMCGDTNEGRGCSSPVYTPARRLFLKTTMSENTHTHTHSARSLTCATRVTPPLSSPSLSNIILAGPPGTGKTTSVHCLARALLGASFKVRPQGVEAGGRGGKGARKGARKVAGGVSID